MASFSVFVLGCDGPIRAAVDGKVYLNGVPLARGTITFQPLTKPRKDHPAAWATIEGGMFTLPVEKGPGLGKCRIEIRSPKQTNRSVPSTIFSADDKPKEPEQLMVEAIPVRFNSASELVADIQPGTNRLEFRLQ